MEKGKVRLFLFACGMVAFKVGFVQSNTCCLKLEPETKQNTICKQMHVNACYANCHVRNL